MNTKKRLTKKELAAGLASGQITYKDPKVKHRKGYETRISSGSDVSDSYPGLDDHPSPEGTLLYERHVITTDSATVWEAIQNEHYAQGGIPKWVRKSLSELDMSVYWQISHYQMQWGGRAHMSFKTLSRNLGVKYRSIQRSVKRLLEIGAIELIQKHTGRRPNAYRVKLLSSLKEMDYVEATGENVEATGESIKGDPTDTQKTKPLKGRVARSPAEAGRATPRKNNSRQLATIDEARKIRAKSISRKEISAKPRLIRSFFPVEANNKKIKEALEIEFLASKWEAVKQLAKVSGDIDLETETFIPAPAADDENLVKLVEANLIRDSFDVRNLPKAIELILDRVTKSLTPKQKELENRLKSWRAEKERKLKLQELRQIKEMEAREKEEREAAERLATQKRIYSETFEFLNNARQFLLLIYPAIEDKVNGWGSVTSFLSELSNKELNQIESQEIRSQLYALSEEIPVKVRELERISCNGEALDYSTLEKLFQMWIEGGEDWRMRASFPRGRH
jgi:predicted transcriptional regulator